MARVRVTQHADRVAPGLAAIRAELGLVEEFSDDVLAEAAAAAHRRPGSGHVDALDLPLVTVDPPGSRDLDQAYHAARRPGGGFRVSYAIADPGHFMAPAGPLDVESRRRGVTFYTPDRRVPLYPRELSEGAASLLPGVDRPAVLWTLDLDTDGVPERVAVRRAVVRSRAQLDYAGVQRALDAGTADEPLVLLKEIGLLRQEAERARGGVSLPVPAQEVVPVDGGFALRLEAPLPVEGWNAQISLLTGMSAARLMVDAQVGVLRTMRGPSERALESLRRAATALRVDWPESVPYADFVRALDPARPAEAAVLSFAATVQRGAGYTAVDGSLPEDVGHFAIAAPYAHATAPLRRLVDRFVSEVVLAVCAGRDVPEWTRRALPDLPRLMAAAGERERAVERAVLDFVEAVTLADHVGRVFEAVAVDANGEAGVVQLRQPPVRARYRGRLPLGAAVRVRLAVADPENRRVEFVPATAQEGGASAGV